MNVFNLETASLADLWAAHSYLKSEITFLQKMLDRGQSVDVLTESISDLIDADGEVEHEIAKRMNHFIQPPIKA